MAGNTTVIERSNTTAAVTPSNGASGTLTFIVDAGYLVFTFAGTEFRIRAA